MSKYDFTLDLNSENSLSMIINMIKGNSKILEFGPAHGRLTKYLLEEKNCIIDIVEIDYEAGFEASKYANKYFIGSEDGNIENYVWLDKLKNEKYDYIIFADVLEHLYYPEKVLENCKKVLRENGSILLSIPNIAHNSVIIDLINDEFKYNNLGLLDNTHIRFFTYKSLNRMIDSCGFVSVNERATYNRVGENEIQNSYDLVSKVLAKELKNRYMANIYQFVFEIKNKKDYLQNKDNLKVINLDESCNYEAVVYIKDIGNYLEQKTIRKNITNNKVELNFSLKDFDNVTEIRVDPINSNCIIKDFNIFYNKDGEYIYIKPISSNLEFEINNILFFENYDPQIYFDTSNLEYENIQISYELLDYDNEYIINIISKLVLYKEIIDTDISQNILEKNKEIENLNTSILEKNKEIENLNTNILEKNKEIENLNIDILEKNKKIENLNANILEKDKNIEILNNNISKKDEEIEKLNSELNNIKNSRSFRYVTKLKNILGK